ncbi:MAG: signal peptidase II [Acidimicrobiales bacterium]|nr:signal peptidase II [Acidimicrobiales bacterium]
MASVDTDQAAPSAAPHRPLRGILAIAAVTIVVDQLTKWWAVSALSDPPRIIDLFWTLRFNLLYNRGTAFSLTDDSGRFVSAVAVVVVIVLLRSARSTRSGWTTWSYGLVIGGTVGNIVDRLFREADSFLGGGVVDFVDLQWFPVFNVADAALVIGIGVLLYAGLFTDALESEGHDTS